MLLFNIEQRLTVPLCKINKSKLGTHNNIYSSNNFPPPMNLTQYHHFHPKYFVKQLHCATRSD